MIFYGVPRKWVTNHILEIIILLQKNLDIRDRRWHMRNHKRCFIAKDAVAIMMDLFSITSRALANEIGELLRRKYVIVHVIDKEKPFEDKHVLFRFRGAFDDLELRRNPTSPRLYSISGDAESSDKDEELSSSSVTSSVSDIVRGTSTTSSSSERSSLRGSFSFSKNIPSIQRLRSPKLSGEKTMTIGDLESFSLSLSTTSTQSSSSHSSFVSDEWEDPKWVKEDDFLNTVEEKLQHTRTHDKTKRDKRGKHKHHHSREKKKRHYSRRHNKSKKNAQRAK